MKSGLTLGDAFSRIIEKASNDKQVSFFTLAEAAGLNPASDFIGARLRDLDFRDEDLRGFNFSNADLTGADFRGANVDGVPLVGAILTDTSGLPLTPKPNIE